MAVPENAASLRVLAKLGFERDGTRTAYGREHVVLRRTASSRA